MSKQIRKGSLMKNAFVTRTNWDKRGLSLTDKPCKCGNIYWKARKKWRDGKVESYRYECSRCGIVEVEK